MEIINPPQEPKNSKDSEQPKSCNPKSGLIPILFIIGGLLFLGRNLDMIDYSIFSILVSWQTLLIVIGFILLVSRNYPGGLVLICLGGAFMAQDMGYIDHGVMFTFWPIIFILLGIGLLFKTRTGINRHHHHHEFTTVHEGKDGYVDSRNTFGDVQRIVLDPVFNGGYIENGFGATRIDLRKSSLPLGTTTINVNCYFGSLDLYIPAGWNVRNEAQPFLGSSDDKRYMISSETDTSRTLVIRGTVTFGSLELKC